MHHRFTARLLVACLVLGGLAAAPGGLSAAEDGDGVPVRLDAFADTVTLTPFDPRTAELAATAPEAADGLFTGTLDRTGGLVRLVHWDDLAVGLVETPTGLEWVTVENGALVPLPASERGALPDETFDAEVEPPTPDAESIAPVGAASHAQDGKLQIMLDADYTYARDFGEAWDEYQLAVIALVDAIYQTNLGVEFEVVEQHVWTHTGPLTGSIECSGWGDDLLVQFRDHWESVKPTTSDVREVAHLFTRQPAVPHPSGGTLIGCGYLAALESSYAYSASRMGVYGTVWNGQLIGAPVFTQHVYLVAHELGHNFDGWHHRAMPTPGSAIDTGCWVGVPTIMYPYLCWSDNPSFSNTHGHDGLFDGLGLVRDGGNVPFMKAHAADRI